MHTFVPGAIASAKEVNENFADAMAENAKRATAVFGTTLTPGDAPQGVAPIIAAGTVVVNVEANGYATFAWPTPFPNGLASVTVSSGDARAFSGVVVLGNNSPNQTWCYIRATGASGVPVRVNYIAVGW